MSMFNIACRMGDLIAKQEILRQYAIGWCRAERLMCRPKLNNMAVMYDVHGEVFWFHLRSSEFWVIFGRSVKRHDAEVV